MVAAALLAALSLAAASWAPALKVISEVGEKAGQTEKTQRIAVDQETGRLYVAEEGNHRVSVFDSDGNFERAFGWGVKNGSSEFQVCTTSCRKGLPGTGSGQFNKPISLAVDNSCSQHDPPLTELTTPTCAEFVPSNGALYVGEPENRRVQKFDISAAGEPKFLLTFGGGVNKSTGADVCVAGSGDICGAGSTGSGEGEFQSAAIFVGVDGGGTVYVVDNALNAKSEPEEVRLQKFDGSGSLSAPQCLLFSEYPHALTVEAAGDFWVGSSRIVGKIHKFEADCTPILTLQIPSDSGVAITGLSLDAEGQLFASFNVSNRIERSILEYDSEGHLSRWFGFGSFQNNITGLGPYQSVSGDIYASESSGATTGRVLQLDFPDPGPIVLPEPCGTSFLGNSKATLVAKVNPEGKATTFHFEYITDADYLANGNSFSGANPATSTPESAPVGSGFELIKASAGLVDLTPETKYHCRVVATNADATVIGEEGTFTTLDPLEILATWATDVGTEAATLNASVNPLGIPTEGFFEYVEEATYQKDIAELGPEHGFDHALKAPEVDGGEPAIDFGAGESPKSGSAHISGLKPGTSYRYRIVADDHQVPPIPGPAKTLRTHHVGEGALPDDRAYELVSPAHKSGAEVGAPGAAGGLSNERAVVKIQAAAGSGEAVTYTSWTSFGDAQGASIASQYLSRRTATGWGTENVSPFGFMRNSIDAPYRGVDPELGSGGFVIDEPPLTPEAQGGFQNLYLRDNADGGLRALTSEAPLFTPVAETGLTDYCTSYAGASADGSRAFFAANGAMAGAPAGIGFSLYESSTQEGLKLVSVLPDGAPAPPARKTRFGSEGSFCTMDQGFVAHAISDDGSKAFWSYGGKYAGATNPLFARIDGTATVQLDGSESNEEGVKNGKGPFGKGTFWAATPDGSRVFFTAPGKLAKDAGAEGHLYLYDFARPEGERRVDLTPGPTDPEIEGVIGVSEAGDHVYFVGEGALTGAQENAAGQKAVKGAKNLYLWHEGEGPRFIARLSNPLDEEAWSSVPERFTARVAAGGDLAFLSVETEALSGYDNTIAAGSGCRPPQGENRETLGGGPLCAEAYLYDAEAKTLTCASCNPSGARPSGPTVLPSWSNPFEGPRYLSDDGSRLFFETFDDLSGADINGKRDVYEFERLGSGTCTSESPDYLAASNGCLSLISTGKSTKSSFFLDASSNGRDVFFATRQPLVGWDTDANYDVYDAREGGGFPEPPPPPPVCVGEACKAAPSAPPNSSTPSTSSFQGPGNVTTRPASRCPKGKARRKGRCVKSRGKDQRKQRSHQRASGKGRTAR